MISKVTYKTNRNLGNMEHESIELEYELDSNFEDAGEVYASLREKAFELLGISTDEPKTTNKKRTK